MRAVPGLRPGNLHAVVPAALDEGLTERLRAVGVGPLSDRQERRVLAERDVLVERGHPGLGPGPARRHRPPAQPLHHRGQVLGRGTAAAAGQGQAELLGEHGVRVGQLGWAQRVPGAVGGQHRQPGVGHAGQRDARVPGQVAQVLAHLTRPGRAVQPDQGDAQRLQGGKRGADLAAQQHGAGGLDGHLGDERELGACRGHGPPRADDRGLGLEQVLAGLDDDRIGPAADQSGRAELVGVPQVGEPGVTQGRELRAWSHGAEHPARTPGRGPLAGRLPGDPGPGLGQLRDSPR